MHTLNQITDQGFASAGDPRSASKLTEQMKEGGLEMDVVNYGTAISACAKKADVKGATKLVKVRRNGRCLFFFGRVCVFSRLWCQGLEIVSTGPSCCFVYYLMPSANVHNWMWRLFTRKFWLLGSKQANVPN